MATSGDHQLAIDTFLTRSQPEKRCLLASLVQASGARFPTLSGVICTFVTSLT